MSARSAWSRFARACRGRLASLCPFVLVTVAALCSPWGCRAYDPDLIAADPSLTGPKSDGGALDPKACATAPDLSVCSRPNADGVCLDKTCSIVRCRPGHFDCDGSADNGCEATLDTADHCGACGASCALSHVQTSRCDMQAAGGSACAIDHGCADGVTDCTPDAPENGCEPGFADCDGDPSNGCETSLHTLQNCGGCGMTCALTGSEESCNTGTCISLGCSSGFGDCGAGCMSLISDAANCGTCGHSCPDLAPNCAGARCTALDCADGTADCDGNSDDGCEADLTSASSCGSCGVSCGPYPNAMAECTKGRCKVGDCKAGYGDCDDTRDNGCETKLDELAHCGSCDNDCGALAHVTSSQCIDGQCGALTCEDGWGDCDGDPKNGCEQSLKTNDHCGSCTASCAPANATASCETGTCTLTACTEGFDDCNDSADDGCEAALDGDQNCGACGNACPAGMACNNGGCACASGGMCAQGTECCNGACVDTRSACFPWPCIPGTSRDKNNCGGCGVACPTWCCAG